MQLLDNKADKPLLLRFSRLFDKISSQYRNVSDQSRKQNPKMQRNGEEKRTSRFDVSCAFFLLTVLTSSENS